MTDTRIERDSMGELAVPATALYGAQTQRAVNNFPVSGQRMPQAFVRALLLAKAAAARANRSSRWRARHPMWPAECGISSRRRPRRILPPL